MQKSRIRLFGGLLVFVFVAGLAGFSLHSVTAQPVTADFAVPMDPAAARLQVAAAQQQQAQLRRQQAQLLNVDPNQLPTALTVYFPQTGHHLSNRSGFLDFWRAHGQVHIFGYPITEEFIEHGRIVQYFERARFELNAAALGTPAAVQLGLIGRELVADDHEGPFAPQADPVNGQGYFSETGHTLHGEFLDFWQRRGGLAIFGFPISSQFDENGQIVQYFERAHFTYNPADMPGFYRSQEQYNGLNLRTLYEVVLGDVGRQLALARGINTAPIAQLPGTAEWTPALWPRHIDVNLSTQWLTAYEGDLVVFKAPIATGRDGFNTPTGEYAIYTRLPMQTMIGNAGGESWNVPNVPWVQYVVGGVALHGTYWHNAFGSGARMSHGCINLSMDDAQWLYKWADIGTTVSIHY
jgi:hypothetical protein